MSDVILFLVRIRYNVNCVFVGNVCKQEKVFG